MSFQIHDSESEASYENRPTSAVNSDVSVLEPSRSALSTHRVSFQEQNSLPIVQTHDQLLERMDENSATNSSHTSNDCIPSRPISTIGVQASVQPQDCHSGGGAINEAPTVNVENAITQERNMLRQELDSLKQRMVGHCFSIQKTILNLSSETQQSRLVSFLHICSFQTMEKPVSKRSSARNSAFGMDMREYSLVNSIL